MTKKRGFDFQAEIGLTYQVSDTNVSVLVDDPDGILTPENVAAEEDEIKDELGDINVFASVTISYLF